MSETPPDETLGAFLGDTAEKIAKAERAAIVAWLRGSDIQRANDIADAIEAGAHHAATISGDKEILLGRCVACRRWEKLHEPAHRLGRCTLSPARMPRYGTSEPPAWCELRKVRP